MILETVPTPHGKLAVWGDGVGERAILHLHGLGGDHNQALNFTPTANELGPGWWRVGVDMRGHGATDVLGPPETLSFAAFAEDVAAVLEWMVERTGEIGVILVGMSMGAEVSLQVAATRPDLARAIVIIRAARAGNVVNAYMVGAYRKVADLLERYGPDGAEAFLRTAEYRHIALLSAATAASLLRQFQRPDAVARAEILRVLPVSPALPLEVVAKIDAPALVLVSPGDPAHPMTCGRLIAQALPQAAPVTILPQKLSEPGAHERQLRAAIGTWLTQLSVPAKKVRPLRAPDVLEPGVKADQ